VSTSDVAIGQKKYLAVVLKERLDVRWPQKLRHAPGRLPRAVHARRHYFGEGRSNMNTIE